MDIVQIQELPKLAERPKDSHKGTYGRVLVVAGSLGMAGAACLTTEAVLRSGAGLVTLATAKSIIPVVSGRLLCAMTYPLEETPEHTISVRSLQKLCELSQSMDCIAIGPGLSQNKETQELTYQFLEKIDLPIIADADALNNIVEHQTILSNRNHPTIITPHPGEFCRLLGISMSQLNQQREQYAIEFARKHNCIVVLKFAPTLVTDGKQIFKNNTGNPGMATGGSGDVLTGIITGLLAQGLTPFGAAQLGVWIHGYAGDLAASGKGQISMIASDILQCLPQAFIDYTSDEIYE